jgi:1,4-alpha-glucan branching enzyme
MLKKAPKGTTSRTRSVQFDLHAPGAQRVSLAGDFNGWDVDALPMKRDRKGTWTTRVSLQPGRHVYRFYVDGGWQDDPGAQDWVDNPFGSRNCVKIVE